MLAIVIGNGLTAWAYSWVLVRANVISGGVTATAMVAARLSGWSVTGWTNLITVSCLLVALGFLGGHNFINSIVSSLSYVGWFSVAQAWPPPLSISLWWGLPLAGLLVGLGYALCLTHHASTAGLDVLALVVHRFWPRIPVARSLRVINLAVLLLGAWQFGLRSFILGLGFILIYTQTLAVVMKRQQRRALA